MRATWEYGLVRTIQAADLTRNKHYDIPDGCYGVVKSNFEIYARSER